MDSSSSSHDEPPDNTIRTCFRAAQRAIIEATKRPAVQPEDLTVVVSVRFYRELRARWKREGR
jgi:hypothetical protein